MTKEQREDFNMAIEDAYDDLLMKTEGRGISYGECTYIANLKESEAQELLEECYNKLNELEEA